MPEPSLIMKEFQEQNAHQQPNSNAVSLWATGVWDSEINYYPSSSFSHSAALEW